MKGSMKGRRVLDRQTIFPEKEIRRSVLKDQDFVELERKIYVSQENCVFLKQQLTQDSLFLTQNNLIDYSLLLFKYDFRDYCQQELQREDYQEFVKELVEHDSSLRYKYVECLREPGVYYMMTIIDYLTPYQILKKVESKLNTQGSA